MSDAKNIAEEMIRLQDYLYEMVRIERKIFFPPSVRSTAGENDAEHSYNLAMIAWFVASRYPELQTDKVLKYALVHDLVEIHAGDVMAIGRTNSEQALKEAREKEALQKITQDWGASFAIMTDTIAAYEEQNDPEAVFVKALDKLSAMIHNIHGKGYTWKKWDMEQAVVFKNKEEKTKSDTRVYELWLVMKDIISNHPEWFNEGKAT